jgi:hypothetical protein
MRALLFLCVCGLAACSNDVFTNGDSGGDASSTPDANADASNDTTDDAPTVGGDASAPGCEVGQTNNCQSCTGTCCVDHTGASCLVSSCAGQDTFALTCTSASDCTIASDVVCCLNVGPTDITKACPRIISTNQSSSSTCTTTTGCSGVRLCNVDSQCPSNHCAAAAFAVDTSVTIGICDL